VPGGQDWLKGACRRPDKALCGALRRPGVLCGKEKIVLDTAGAQGILLVGVWVVRHSRDLARGSRRGVPKKVKKTSSGY